MKRRFRGNGVAFSLATGASGTVAVTPRLYRGTRKIGGRKGDSLKFRDVVKLIEADGWFLVGQQGSHRQFKHPVKNGRVTVAGKPAHDVPKKTLASILKQAQLKERP